MMKKHINCIPLTMVIKGTPESVQKALSMPLSSSCEYNLAETIDAAAKLVVVHVGISDCNLGEINTKDIPFAAMPDVKFIMFANHNSYSYSSRGSYIVYKGFGATEVEFCKRFSFSSVFEEEIDDEVAGYFLDTQWCYEYTSYSDDMDYKMEYTFPDEALWNDDSAFKADGIYSDCKSASIVDCVVCNGIEYRDHQGCSRLHRAYSSFAIIIWE